MRILLKDLGLTLPQHLRHSLIRYAARTEARDRAVDWALTDKGKERDWFWRYKFHFDRAVQFRPELYGWSWIEGARSWVIPPALMMVALKQFVYCKPRAEVSNRLRLGAQMLLDRSCRGGGRNAGNSVVVYGAFCSRPMSSQQR